MSKLMQVYGLSIDEALRLSDAHVELMLDTLESAAAELLKNDTEFQRSLNQKLAPVRRAVRADLQGGWLFDEPPEEVAEEPRDQGASEAETDQTDSAPSDAAPVKPPRPKPPDKAIGKPPKV